MKTIIAAIAATAIALTLASVSFAQESAPKAPSAQHGKKPAKQCRVVDLEQGGSPTAQTVVVCG